jgi:hypothetical protein
MREQDVITVSAENLDVVPVRRLLAEFIDLCGVQVDEVEVLKGGLNCESVQRTPRNQLSRSSRDVVSGTRESINVGVM